MAGRFVRGLYEKLAATVTDGRGVAALRNNPRAAALLGAALLAVAAAVSLVIWTNSARAATYQDYVANANNTYTPFDVTFPQGNDSFADTASNLTRVAGVTNGTAAAAQGPPNSPAPPAGADSTSVSLGDGGAIIARFSNNVLRGNGVTGDNAAGADLYVFEAGSIVELVDVYVAAGSNSACPTTALSYTLAGRTTSNYGGVDIDDNGFDASSRLFCVRLVDVLTDQPNGGSAAGAEIDAVGAMSTYLQGDVSVRKTASPASPNAGDNLTYTITGSNLGPGPVNAATVTDVLPANTTFVSSTASQGSCSGTSTVTCNLGTLNGGATATATIVVRPNAAAAGTTLSNSASIAHGATDPDSSNNTSDSDAGTAGNQATTTAVANRAPTAQADSYSTPEGQRLDVAATGVLGNDTDPDNNPMSAELVTGVGSGNGTLTLNPNGSFAYTPPDNDYNGVVTFVYRACDDRPAATRQCSANRTVTITVNPVNDPPSAGDDTKATDEDRALTFPAGDLLANDTAGPANESGQTLTVISVQGATNGTVSLSGGQITFTPNADFSGAASFTYTVGDGQGGTATGTVTVNVNPVNDAPDAVNDSRTIDEDASAEIRVLDNDTDPERNALTISSVSEPQNGTATVNAGVITYTPRRDFSGTDTFTYAINDGNGGMDTATVTVVVAPVNDAPVNGVPAGQSVDEDGRLVFSQENGNRLSVSDADAADRPVRVALSVPQGSGTISLASTSGLGFESGDGTADRAMTFTGTIGAVNAALDGLRFDPAADFNGAADLTLTTNDQGNTGSGGAREDRDTVAINVRAVNDAPTLDSIPARTVEEDQATGDISFTVGDLETAAGDLVVSATSSDQQLVPDGNIRLGGTGAQRTINVTPAANRSGETTITVLVRDAGGAVITRTFVLTVRAVNDAPTLDLNGAGEGNGYSGSFREGAGPTPAAGSTALATDIDSDTLSSATVTQTNRPDGGDERLAVDVSGTGITADYDPATGVLRLAGRATVAEYGRVLRSVTYENASQNPDTADRRIEFVVNDGERDSNAAVATISVARTNDPPAANDDSYSTDEDQPLTVDAPGLLANDSDVDRDDLTVRVGREPARGRVVINEDGSFTYTPEDDYFGEDTFTYTVSDGRGGTATATVRLTVRPVNDQPLAREDRRTIPEDQTLVVPGEQLTQDDSAGPGEGDQTLTIISVQDARNGTVRLDDDGNVVFTPAPDFNGEASFTYTISDGEGGTATGTVVVVDITPINDPPTAGDDAAETAEDESVRIGVLGNDSPGPEDERGQSLSVEEVTDGPLHGEATINDDGTVTYAPFADFYGRDVFIYRVCDSSEPRRCDTAKVTVDVAARNDAPRAGDDRYEIQGGAPLTVDAPGVLDDDRDLDGDELTARVDRAPEQGEVEFNEDGSFTYTPASDFDGEDTFTYTVSDGQGGTATATVTITNTVINDPPVATDDDGLSVDEDGNLDIPASRLTSNDSPGPGEAGQNLVIRSVADGRNGAARLDGGRVIFTPDPDYHGDEASFSYTVCDDGTTDGRPDEQCATATAKVSVTPVNDPPVVDDDTRVIAEDQVLEVDVAEFLQDDSAGPNEGDQTLSVQSVGDARGGQVRLAEGRAIFTPAPDFNGEASFTYTISDGEGGTATGTVRVQVTPINDPPTAGDDSATLEEDESVRIGVLGNDSPGPEDERGQSLSVEEVTDGPLHGEATINDDGTVTYAPFADFLGEDSFGYRVCDDAERSRCDIARVNVTVAPINDAPVNDAPGPQTVAEDGVLVFSQEGGNRLSVSDADAGERPVRVSLSAANGVLNIDGSAGLTFESGDGEDDAEMTFTGPVEAVNAALDGLRFAPNTDFSGAAQVRITTNDLGNSGSGGALEDTDVVAVTVEAVNDAATISTVEDTRIEEDAATGEIRFTVGDVETAAGDLVVSATSLNTDLVPNENVVLGGSGAERTVRVTPTRNASGQTTITLTVRDGEGREVIETFVVVVEPVNDAPQNSVPSDPQETNEDASLVFSDEDGNAISVSDPDSGGDPVSVVVSVPEGSGTLENRAAENVEVTGGGTNRVTFTGTVANVNVAVDGLRFVPAANTNGPVRLTVSVNDGGNNGSGGELTDEDSLTIDVVAENDRPTFDLPEDAEQTVDEDAGPQTVEDFATGISQGPNEPGQRVRFEVSNDNNALFARDGSPTVSPEGTLAYTPARDANGTATVTVVAVDDAGTPEDTRDDLRGERRTFVINVSPVNDAPIISEVEDRTTDEDTATGPITFTVGDVETDENDLVVSATSSRQELVPSENITVAGGGAERTVDVRPAANVSGTVTITLMVRDAAGREVVRSFTLTIEPVNDDPTAVNDEKSATEDEALTFPAIELLDNDSSGPNEDGQTLNVVSVGGAQNGSVSLREGRITFTPDRDYNGPASFTYTVEDDQGARATATVELEIAPANDPPTIDLNGDGPGTDYASTFREGGDPAPAADPDALVVGDIDSENLGSATVTLTDRPDGDAESLAADTRGTGISASYDPETGVLTLTGDAPKDRYRQVLATVTYRNDSQNPTVGDRRVDFVVRDGESGQATAMISVEAVNDAPAVTTTSGASVYAENDAPTAVDPDATVSDPDSPDFDGGRLVVEITGGATNQDRLTIRNAGGIGVEGETVTYSGASIGTFSGGFGGEDPLVVALNENATPEAVQALVRGVAFSTQTDSPSEQPRTVSFVLTDGDGGESEAATKPVNVSAANDAPTLSLGGDGSGYAGDFVEDGGPVPAADPDALAVDDADDENVEGAVVRLTNRPDGDAESLAVTVPVGSPISASYDPETGVLTLAGSANLTQYRDVLRSVTYENASQNPDTADRRIEFVVNDGERDSETAVSTIRVSRAPDVPTPANDTARADEGGDAVVVDVLFNDSDPDGDRLTVAEVTQPPEGEGTVEIVREGADAGRVRYVPSADFYGGTRFTYTVSDGNGATATATVNVFVEPTNDDPDARDDEYSAPEDSEFVRFDVLFNDTDDPDAGENLTVRSVGNASDGGTVEIVEDGAAIRYRPVANFNGTETFTYTISDGNGGTDTATVTVVSNPDNDAPELGGLGGEVTYTENDAPTIVDPDATVSDPDSPDFDGGELVVSLTDNAQPDGRLGIRNVGTGAGEIGTDGDAVTYSGASIGTFSGGFGGEDPLVVALNENATPEAVQALVRSLTYSNTSENPSQQPRKLSIRLADGDGGTATGQKTINVVAVNDPPTVELTRAPTSTDEGGALGYEFAVTDVDSDRFTLAEGFPSCGEGRQVEGSVTTGPSGGTFRCSFPDGPATPTVSVRVVDTEGAQSNTASREVEVANVAPEADGDGPYAATEDTTLTVDRADGVLSGDTDPGDDALIAELVEGPPAETGELTLREDGSFTFVPAENFRGTAGFTYRACEAGGEPRVCSETVRVDMEVAPVNDAPNAEGDEATTREDEAVTVDVLADDTDPDGSDDLAPGSLSVVRAPDDGRTEVVDGGIRYVPNANFNGDDSFVYQICDAANRCDTAVVRVTVTAVNDAPTARNDETETPEDVELRIPQADLLDNDDAGPSNESGQQLRITEVGEAEGGTVRLAANGDVIFTPDPGFDGLASFSYTVTDGQGNTDTATARVDVTVSAVDDEPVAQPDEETTREDEAITVDVLSNDTDPENDSLSIAEGSLTQPRNGAVEVVDGRVRYTPNADFNGTDTFTYRASTGNGATTQPVTVTITVTAVNDRPSGTDDSYEVEEDAPFEAPAPGVLSNDADPDEGDELRVRVERNVSDGTLTLNPDGSFRYAPNGNFNGRDTFTYVVIDGDDAESEPVTVTLSVAVANDTPEPTDDASETDEDRQTTIDVLSNDTDPDGDDLTVRSVGRPGNGTAEIRSGSIVYTPNTDFNGEDSFEYTVADTDGATATATVRVTVRPVNDPPEAADDEAETAEDTELRISQADLLRNDAPGPGGETGQLRVTAVDNARNGTVRLADDGTIVFVPAPNFSGPASFSYTVTDGGGGTATATATVDVTVSAFNDAPEANDDSADTGEDRPVGIDVLANDTDPEGALDAASVRVVTQPRNGDATVNRDGTITYDPRDNFFGTDTIVYQVCDAEGDCDTATVQVLVGSSNDAPTANDDGASTDEDESVEIDVLANDDDPEGREELDPASVRIVTEPARGTATVAAGGAVTYEPALNYTGGDSFEYEVCDTGRPAQCDIARVDLTVRPVNDPPVARDGTARAVENGGPVVVDVLSNDTDPDGDGLSIAEVTQPPAGEGTVEIIRGGPNVGKVRYVPSANFYGNTRFAYTVSDGRGGTANANVDVTVQPTNDPPTATEDRAQATQGGAAVRIDVLSNDRVAPDADETLMVTDFTQPQSGRGRVALLPSGALEFTPDPAYSGQATFTYTVSDGNGGTATATVTVDVAPAPNNAPSARDDRASTGEAAAVSNAFVSQYPASTPSTPTRLYKFDTTKDPYALTKVGSDVPGPTNAIGYRSTDRSIYGYRTVGTPGVVKINPTTGATRYLGNPKGLPASKSYIAGDVSPDGSTYYLYANKSGVLQKIDIASLTASSVQLSAKAELPDLAVSPTDGKLYGVARDGKLLRIDPSTGQITAISVAGIGPGTYGAAWFTARGDLIVYENGTPQTSGTLNWITRPASATPTLAGTQAGPYTQGNDGAAYVTAPNPAGLSAVIDVLSNDSDPDGGLNRNSLRVIQRPASGSVVVNADKTITYTTNGSYRGSDSFRYEVCDAGAPRRCATATVSVTAAPVGP